MYDTLQSYRSARLVLAYQRTQRKFHFFFSGRYRKRKGGLLRDCFFPSAISGSGKRRVFSVNSVPLWWNVFAWLFWFMGESK
jgi:hypothetical protein